MSTIRYLQHPSVSDPLLPDEPQAVPARPADVPDANCQL